MRNKGQKDFEMAAAKKPGEDEKEPLTDSVSEKKPVPKKRQYSIDWIRAHAITFVVLVHAIWNAMVAVDVWQQKEIDTTE